MNDVTDNPYGYTLTIFNTDGTHQGAVFSGPSEPVEENEHTIRRLVGADPTIKHGTYIATMHRHRHGVQSRIIHVIEPVPERVVCMDGQELAAVEVAVELDN